MWIIFYSLKQTYLLLNKSIKNISQDHVLKECMGMYDFADVG